MKRLINNLLIILLLTMTVLSAYALPFSDPFKWNTELKGDTSLEISVAMSAHHYLYKKETLVIVKNSSKQVIKPIKIPQFVNHFDKLSNSKTDVYMAAKLSWIFPKIDKPQLPYLITISYQGCKDKDKDGAAQCFIPNSQTFFIGKDEKLRIASEKDIEMYAKMKVTKNSTSSESTNKITINEKRQRLLESITNLLNDFTISKNSSGVMTTTEMLSFLNIASKEQTMQDEKDRKVTLLKAEANNNDLVVKLRNKSVIVMILLIFLGGLSLNLTPCVLPLIPINLAVIGAGNAAESKFAGLFRGSIYALGIMISYGILGLIAVLAGTPLGSLNSSPWFNFIITIIFVVLGLGMFDVFVIDLSRYGSSLGPKVGEKVGYFWTFFLGVITALLAGACVAPVVIAVLILSADLSQDGSALGFILPFILGLGMASPWPLAGAGISVLPKPGMWMNKVKHSLGAIIFLLAIYYAYEGYKLLPNKEDLITKELEHLEAKLQLAKKENKPVFIDFWATWCKNCLTMNATTFKDKDVIKALEENYVEVKFQAEKPNKQYVKDILQLFKVQGMPEYRILIPKKAEKRLTSQNKLKNLFK